MSQDRRNDFDVSNTVQVSDPASVRDAVHALFSETFPGMSFDKLWLAFYDFERLFTGRYPGYKGCDTTYHDMQHSLDMTLAVARLIVGYERSAELADRLGSGRAQMAVITALFHDSGYIRHEVRDKDFTNGAQFTLYHVSRSADFLRRYLPELGMAGDVGVSSMIVHFHCHSTNDELIVEPVAAFLEVAAIRHLSDKVRRADQVPTDNVAWIIEFNLIEIEFVAGEMHDHAANANVPGHPEFRKVAAKEVGAA